MADFSFNIANPLTTRTLWERFPWDRLTASYDLNLAQLGDLLTHSPPQWFEITLHQHMPMFHMEHCVFCAFLSSGTDYTNCGRPCENHTVKLRDRTGVEHLLKADAGCRNTLFNGKAQTGAAGIPYLLQHGTRHFRLEFLDESPTQITTTLQAYRGVMKGESSGSQLWRDLTLINQLGVTRGQF